VSDRTDAALALAGAPGTIAGLLGSLILRLTGVMGRFALETKTDRRVPSVVAGWLPPKEDTDAEDFPFVLVRPKSGTDTEQNADQNGTVIMELIVGTYSDTDDGFVDVTLLIDAVRDDLNSAPVIDGTAYEHIGPLTWEIPEQQPRPQWFGRVLTNWQIPRAMRIEARNPTSEV
jgi:hypothetical protein